MQMKTYVIRGTEDRELVIRETNRANATFLFATAFPKAAVDSLESDGEVVTCEAICDACSLPIFSDEDDVGADCNLHEKCADGSD